MQRESPCISGKRAGLVRCSAEDRARRKVSRTRHDQTGHAARFQQRELTRLRLLRGAVWALWAALLRRCTRKQRAIRASLRARTNVNSARAPHSSVKGHRVWHHQLSAAWACVHTPVRGCCRSMKLKRTGSPELEVPAYARGVARTCDTLAAGELPEPLGAHLECRPR